MLHHFAILVYRLRFQRCLYITFVLISSYLINISRSDTLVLSIDSFRTFSCNARQWYGRYQPVCPRQQLFVQPSQNGNKAASLNRRITVPQTHVKKKKKNNLVTRKGVRTKRAQALYDFPTIPSFVLIETYHPTHNGYRVVLIQTAIATNKRAAVQGPNVRLNKFFSNERLPELPTTLFAYERRAHEIRHFHFSPLTKIVSLLFWPEIISAGCSTLCYKGDIFGLSPKVPTV